MRRVGGAHRGLDMWIVQRASALYMVIYLLVFAGLVFTASDLEYHAWRDLFAPLAMRVATLLFAAALLAHAWIGLREIFIDYVHPMAIRLPLLFAFGVLYLGCLVWAADILWSLS